MTENAIMREGDLAKAMRDAYGQGFGHGQQDPGSGETAAQYWAKRDAWIRQYIARMPVAVREGRRETPEPSPQSSPTLKTGMMVEEAIPCHWGGGNDIIWCSTCGAEYAYAKGEERPACPRTLQGEAAE